MSSRRIKRKDAEMIAQQFNSFSRNCAANVESFLFEMPHPLSRLGAKAVGYINYNHCPHAYEYTPKEIYLAAWSNDQLPETSIFDYFDVFLVGANHAHILETFHSPRQALIVNGAQRSGAEQAPPVFGLGILPPAPTSGSYSVQDITLLLQAFYALLQGAHLVAQVSNCSTVIHSSKTLCEEGGHNAGTLLFLQFVVAALLGAEGFKMHWVKSAADNDRYQAAMRLLKETTEAGVSIQDAVEKLMLTPALVTCKRVAAKTTPQQPYGAPPHAAPMFAAPAFPQQPGPAPPSQQAPTFQAPAFAAPAFPGGYAGPPPSAPPALAPQFNAPQFDVSGTTPAMPKSMPPKVAPSSASGKMYTPPPLQINCKHKQEFKRYKLSAVKLTQESIRENYASGKQVSEGKTAIIQACQHWYEKTLANRTAPTDMKLCIFECIEDFPVSSVRLNHSVRCQVQQGRYGYEHGGSHWYVDFANKKLGGGFLGNGLVQEEIMCLEFYEFGVIAATMSQDLKTMGQREAVTLEGAERSAAIMNVYGRQVDSLRSQEAMSKVIAASSPPLNFVAIDAPNWNEMKGVQVYERDYLEFIFNKALTGFYGAAVRSQAHITVHTGLWGCGAFRNNPGAMYVLQAMAADAAGAQAFLFYGDKLEGQKASLVEEGRQLWEMACQRRLSVDQVLNEIMRRPNLIRL
eukprot:TRINITY_DN3930_c0_g2_i2.p1 TRINITY_DN3930_c0_g2~~TRINITY_DN3930_c0_g2_i2.p1  ORF type:complete len:685 (-),score=155.68 TRINITY_DN3930_c0_g2_i2:40-2094(-)